MTISMSFRRRTLSSMTPVIIVGTWYGMNYVQQMPELNSKHGYWWAIGLTVVSTLATAPVPPM